MRFQSVTARSGQGRFVGRSAKHSNPAPGVPPIRGDPLAFPNADGRPRIQDQWKFESKSSSTRTIGQFFKTLDPARDSWRWYETQSRNARIPHEFEHEAVSVIPKIRESAA
jgi:hypothetical protein